MRIVLKKGALASTLRQAQWLSSAAAMLMLGYCGFVLTDSWMFQNRQNRLLETALHNRRAIADRTASPAAPAMRGKPLPATIDGLIGRIDILRLGVSAIVIEGTGSRTLRRAVGHIPGTALPGEPGNVGISGHRDTFFRPLRNVQRNDIIMVATLAGEYRYRVVSTRIVSPNDVAVLAPGATETLTLVTCYPFYYVGSAPKRFIVRAERTL